MSYMMIHSLYLWKLFNPFTLCYDYGWACIAPVVSLLDYRNVLSLGVYSSVVAFGFYGGMLGDAIYLWAGALLVVPFIPASNAFFPVGTVLGERLLYLPSVGFCLGVPVVAWDLATLYLRAGKSKGKKKDDNGNGNRSGKGPDSSKKRLVRIVLAATVIPFSAKCISRGTEWRDERTLFEAAMGVCPTSLKVLNNLALTLLHKETAPRAGRLLDEALELFPDYPSALFNRGLAHFVLQEDAKAVSYFERR
jgi:tetratricopeptide (TPR) repeat protein